MSASAYGVGRLPPWERAAAGLAFSWDHGLGAWSSNGAFRAHGERTEEDLRLRLWSMARFSDRGTAWIQLAGHRGLRSGQGLDGPLSSSAVGPADADLGLRWDWRAVGEERGKLAIATTVALTVPVGTSPAESDDPLAADVSGRGAYALSAALILERTWMPWYLRATLGASVPLPTTRENGSQQRLGPAPSLALATGRQLLDGLVLSALLRTTWEAPIRMDGAPVPGSEAWTSVGTVALAWSPVSDWTVQLAASSAPPIAGLGRNRPVMRSLTIGIRRGAIGAPW